MKYKTPVSLVLAALALLMLGAVLPSVAADGQSTQVKKGHAVMEKLAKQSVRRLVLLLRLNSLHLVILGYKELVNLGGL